MKYIAITPGDPFGVGPEVFVKNFKTLPKKHGYFIIGNFSALHAEFKRQKVKLPIDSHIILARSDNHVIEQVNEQMNKMSMSRFIFIDAPKGHPGYQCGWAIVVAVQLILSKIASALVTGPISKENLQKGGFKFFGHTDFIDFLVRKNYRRGLLSYALNYSKRLGAGLLSEKDVEAKMKATMMLANQHLRVSLVSIHCPLKDVSQLITKKNISQTIENTYLALNKYWKIKKPTIAVCGLNPHSGENGILGTEEIQIISPCIASLRKKWGSRLEIIGPIPSDTLFAVNHLNNPKNRYDAVIAMYHDQGLIPVKLLDFPNTVNVTLGLPIIRTSVDHGTGFDIAGKGIADPRSMFSAVQLASRFIS